jgi:hypothetical protein
VKIRVLHLILLLPYICLPDCCLLCTVIDVWDPHIRTFFNLGQATMAGRGQGKCRGNRDDDEGGSGRRVGVGAGKSSGVVVGRAHPLMVVVVAAYIYSGP